MNRLLLLMLIVSINTACAVPEENLARVASLHGRNFSIELATDAASREHGLMMREALATDHGMVFAFVDESPRGFWMKNTLIPLDILYFDTNRRLVSMRLDALPCKADPCPLYPSNAPARYVFELSAGTAKRVGVQIGDELKIEGAVGTVR